VKVFISWSGARSRAVAEALCEWLPQVIQTADPWISTDNEKGNRWNSEISANLEATDCGDDGIHHPRRGHAIQPHSQRAHVHFNGLCSRCDDRHREEALWGRDGGRLRRLRQPLTTARSRRLRRRLAG